jgi:uncharacterized protein
MRIAIISDTHDNVPNLEKALQWMNNNGIEQIIHCGDLCAPSILINVLAPGFPRPINMVFGNIEDRDLLPEAVKGFHNVKHYGDVGEVELGGKKIAFIHYPDKAKKMAKIGTYDFIFYGHNHIAWEETIGKTRVVNPGTLAGLFAKATFAVYDTKSNKLELKILELL